jgi:hypothetical protein
MSAAERRSAGGRWVELSTLAACFDCEVAWLTRVYGQGMLGEGKVEAGLIHIQSRYVERLAVVYRLTFCYGFDLETVEVLIADSASED